MSCHRRLSVCPYKVAPPYPLTPLSCTGKHPTTLHSPQTVFTEKHTAVISWNCNDLQTHGMTLEVVCSDLARQVYNGGYSITQKQQHACLHGNICCMISQQAYAAMAACPQSHYYITEHRQPSQLSNTLHHMIRNTHTATSCPKL